MEVNNQPILPPGSMKAETDFDRSEPHAWLITAFGAITVIGLVAVILGVQFYFDQMTEREVYEKVLVPVSADLKNLHNQEDEELNSYKYIDRDKGVVQIPIARAMQLIASEAAAGKLSYFQKVTPVKVPTVPGAAPAANGAAAAGAAAPAAAAPGTTPAPAAAGTLGSTGGAAGSPAVPKSQE